MTRQTSTPQITDLDLMLYRERGWSFSETQDSILAAAAPRPPGPFRIGAARLLRKTADWVDARVSSSAVANRPFAR
jgi:hypothetical protein